MKRREIEQVLIMSRERVGKEYRRQMRHFLGEPEHRGAYRCWLYETIINNRDSFSKAAGRAKTGPTKIVELKTVLV